MYKKYFNFCHPSCFISSEGCQLIGSEYNCIVDELEVYKIKFSRFF